ncbi:unnamed protein product [Nesidiocoris tenuis]|uniref:Uncharacterized protein n=1 Tax=Nesidiocoris tenuis TaxID=355587 RepID=A0A6H5GAJ5_9HEMI|nr:unnamed protein product [Nesidiocoris tenuis]
MKPIRFITSMNHMFEIPFQVGYINRISGRLMYSTVECGQCSTVTDYAYEFGDNEIIPREYQLVHILWAQIPSHLVFKTYRLSFDSSLLSPSNQFSPRCHLNYRSESRSPRSHVLFVFYSAGKKIHFLELTSISILETSQEEKGIEEKKMKKKMKKKEEKTEERREKEEKRSWFVREM